MNAKSSISFCFKKLFYYNYFSFIFVNSSKRREKKLHSISISKIKLYKVN